MRHFLKTTILGAVGALVLIGAQTMAPTAPATAETKANPGKPGRTKPPADVESVSAWEYSTEMDQMRGTQNWFATTVSAKQLTFESPYDGGVTASLILRHMGGKIDAMVLLSKGQFLCHSYGSDAISVKFDQGRIQSFTCTEPADGTTGLLFIHPAEKFLAALKKSRNVVIEAPFYQAGTRQMPFDISGLAWN